MKLISLATAALTLVVGSASAADLAIPFKSGPAEQGYSWTGCYGGAQLGGAFGQTSFNDSAGIVSGVTGVVSAASNTVGYIIGGQIGCDYQFSRNFVLGIEGAAAGARVSNNLNFANPVFAPDTTTFNTNTNLVTSATARVGFAFDRWLVYGKGGAAWASQSYALADTGGNFNYTAVEDRFGWTAGAGIEWAFTDMWSAKLEYDYYGFGTSSVTFTDQLALQPTGPLNVNFNIQTVKLGVNLRLPAQW